jgi:hypothetical protein
MTGITSTKLVVSQYINLTTKGFIGYDYLWPIAKNSTIAPRCMSYYKWIGTYDDGYIIQTLNNSGGTGNFAGIFLLKRQGDNVTLENIATGDRCNGGVHDVTIKNQTLNYQIDLTPFDLFGLAKNNPHHLNAYDDLAACAVCCGAIANISRDFMTTIGPEELQSVELGTPNGYQGKYEACFNNLIETYKKKGKKIVNSQEIGQLVQDFNKNCFSQPIVKP